MSEQKLDGTTHSERCWAFHRGHYNCALDEIQRLEQDLARFRSSHEVLIAENDRLRMAERLNVETVANFQKRIEWLENICHAAYQLAGVVGAPVRFLDALALHEDVNTDELLPITIEECSEFNGAGK